MKLVSSSFRSRTQALSRLLPLIVLLGCLCLAVASCAQTVDHKETRTSLQTKVHLKLGETTLAKTLQELSKQTGLQIQPTDYLEDRDLLVELDNMSAQAVLETLAEANDWIWYEAKLGQIFMARPRFERTQQLLNVAPAFRAIVPKDLRRFVGLDVSDAEIRSAFRHSQPHSKYVLTTPEWIESLPPRLLLLPQMLADSVKEQERQMAAWVTDDVKAGKKIPYAKLTMEQQHSLLARFVLSAMSTAFDPNGAAKVITGLDPAEVDENRMRISYTSRDGGIYIGILQEGKFTLGEGIMSEKDLPDPLFLHP